MSSPDLLNWQKALLVISLRGLHKRWRPGRSLRLTNPAAIFTSACQSVIAANAAESTFPWRPLDRGDENTFTLSMLVCFPGRGLPIRFALFSLDSYLGNISGQRHNAEPSPCILLLLSFPIFWALLCWGPSFLQEEMGNPHKRQWKHWLPFVLAAWKTVSQIFAPVKLV